MSDTINSKVKWELYLQQRTQNTVLHQEDIFESNQFKSIWYWLHYSAGNHSRFSISPIGFFKTYVLNPKPLDEQFPTVREFRISARYENEQKGRIVNYANRYSIEYRLRDLMNNDQFLPNWRVRYMAKIEKPVFGILSKNKPVTFILNDEVFLQIGKAVKNNPDIFDQNRVYVGASYEPIKNIKTSLGYIYGYQERNSGKEFDNIHYLWLVISFENIFSQFY